MSSQTPVPAPHSYKLSNLAAFLLLDACEAPGWCKTNSELRSAFELVGKLDPFFPAGSVPAEVRKAPNQRTAKGDAPDWCAAIVSLPLTDKQRDAARKALTTHRDAGRLSPGFATLELLDTFAID